MNTEQTRMVDMIKTLVRVGETDHVELQDAWQAMSDVWSFPMFATVLAELVRSTDLTLVGIDLDTVLAERIISVHGADGLQTVFVRLGEMHT